MKDITLGNLLTIIATIIGLVVQYIAITMSFTERITKVEVIQDRSSAELKEHIQYDINEFNRLKEDVYESKKRYNIHREAD